MPTDDPTAAPTPPRRRAQPAPAARGRDRLSGRRWRTEPDKHPDPSPRTAQRRRVRLVANAALGAGVTLFLVAGMTGSRAASRPPSATASTTAAAVARRPPSAAPSPTASPVSSAPSVAPKSTTRHAPRHLAAHKRARKHAPAPAPATKAVISGLAADGIPSTALNAYRVAAARMASADPSCGIQWSLLAGIGRVESNHGRFGGAVLRTDGTSAPRVIGPALNGKGNQLISAPAGGAAQSGDAVYTHALGPMQFIPQTWATYGTDANGDGKIDIFNINDAALSAARYLCAAGGNLRTTAGRVRAVFSYNHSYAYVAEVLALAEAYRSGMTVTGVPIGEVTGTLPPVTGSATPPPVNPGAPTAVSSGDKKHHKTPRKKHKKTKHRTGTGAPPSTGPRSSPPPRRPSSSAAPSGTSGPPTATTTSRPSPTSGARPSPTAPRPSTSAAHGSAGNAGSPTRTPESGPTSRADPLQNRR